MSSGLTSVDEWVRTFEGPVRDAPGLKAIKATLLLQAAGIPAATLKVDDGRLQVTRATGAADASLNFADARTLVDVMEGRLNPIVAVLQGRMHATGKDLILATKFLTRLQAGNPFRERAVEEGVQYGR
jgi:hypothetical protein